MMEWALLASLAAVVLWWLDSMRAREAALKAGKRACQGEGVQFLDDTLELRRVRLRRDNWGQLAFHREYQFEFSDTGDNRCEGKVATHGGRAGAVELSPYRPLSL
jgi:hypothetical protein